MLGCCYNSVSSLHPSSHVSNTYLRVICAFVICLQTSLVNAMMGYLAFYLILFFKLCVYLYGGSMQVRIGACGIQKSISSLGAEVA